MGVSTFEDAVATVQARRSQQTNLVAQMIAVQQRYNGDFAIPLPSKEQSANPPLAPALLAEAIDQPAMRASSVANRFYCPALDPDKQLGVRSSEYARIRRRALGATYFESGFELLRRRMFRHIGGYSSSALIVVPDERAQMPRIELRDPLSAYPDPRAPEDPTPPCNAGFVFQRSASWLLYTYGDAVMVRNGGPVTDAQPQWQSELWDMVEWIDDERCWIGIMGPHSTNIRNSFPPAVTPTMLRTFPNKAGVCPVAVPAVITLDKIYSRLVSMIGKADMMSYLIDLDIMATEASIRPDRYVIARNGGNPEIVGGRWKDGRTGEVNMLTDVDQIGELRGSPDPNNKATIANIERYARLDGAAVAPYGGETSGMSGQLRTGRGIDSLMGVAVDPRVQELQEIACAHLRKLNEAIFATYEGWWPTKKYTVFSGWAGDTGHVSFRPRTHFAESHANICSYPIPGADVGQITVQLAQMVQAELISRREARLLHPHVADAEAAEQEVIVEAVRTAVLQALLARATGNGLPPEDAARILELVTAGEPIEQAVMKAQREAQERQAAQPAPPGPGMAAPPETMPGLANPGEGSETLASPAAPPAAAPGLDLQRLAGALMGGGGRG